MSEQQISCLVKAEGGAEFLLTTIYAHNDEGDKLPLWSELTQISQIVQTSNLPWMIGGDFNIVRYCHEILEGNLPTVSAMEAFNKCIDDLDLMDHRSKGHKYTWCSNWSEGACLRKLDRYLCNQAWLSTFNSCEVLVEPPAVSDHCPTIVRLRQKLINGPKPFKYHSLWEAHPTYESIILKAWEKEEIGTDMDILLLKLRSIKEDLKNLNRAHYSDISLQAEQARNQLEQVQTLVYNGDTSVERMVELKNRRSTSLKLSYAEESFMREKSRMTWLEQGDFNTKYFHRSLLAYQSRVRIGSLKNDSGELFSEPEEVEEEIIGYFKKIFMNERTLSLAQGRLIKGLIGKKVSAGMNEQLSAVPSTTEVKNAFFSMAHGKSPGPDGFTVEFYCKTWQIIGDQVYKAVKHFFVTGHLPAKINATFISIIPKVDHPVSMKEYRPIACCNILYKAISKIIVTRLQRSMDKLISSQQSAFIKGRTLQDNVLIMTEMVAGYHKQDGVPRVL